MHFKLFLTKIVTVLTTAVVFIKLLQKNTDLYSGMYTVMCVMVIIVYSENMFSGNL